MKKLHVSLSLGVLLAGVQALAGFPSTLSYGLEQRTTMGPYRSDPNAVAEFGPEAMAKCRKPLETLNGEYEFEPGTLGRDLSIDLFGRFPDAKIIVYVSIPLQKELVLDRSRYETYGDGLRYAWTISTGFHDQAYAVSGGVFKKEIVAQPSAERTFWTDHASPESAIAQLKKIASSSPGAVYSDLDGTPKVTFSTSPTKSVEFRNIRVRARANSLRADARIIGRDQRDPNYMIVESHALIYTDYFRTQPGYYLVRKNRFSSKHISRESDGSTDTSLAYMPWALFFNPLRGKATHGTGFVSALGTPASHGCVRMREENACVLFHLIGNTEIGQVSAINEETGIATGAMVESHRAMYVVNDELNNIESNYLLRYTKPIPKQNSGRARNSR